MTDRQIRYLVKFIFTNGQKKVADSLVLTDAEGRDLGGWGQDGMASAIKRFVGSAELKKVKPK